MWYPSFSVLTNQTWVFKIPILLGRIWKWQVVTPHGHNKSVCTSRFLRKTSFSWCNSYTERRKTEYSWNVPAQWLVEITEDSGVMWCVCSLTVVVRKHQHGESLQSLCELIVRPGMLSSPVSNEDQRPGERKERHMRKRHMSAPKHPTMMKKF